MQNRNYNGSKPEILRLLWDIIVFRLVSYLLNTKFHTKLYIYMNFRIILTQFYINFSRQEHLMCIVQRHEIIRFHPIPPFIFPLQSL